jgi:drug/metabolite transporter (DMT)-like permease
VSEICLTLQKKIVMALSHIGEIAGLGVSLCWTMSALFFEKAGTRIGSLSVNFIRLLLALLFLGLTTLVTKGLLLPIDATGYQWFWLGLSGVIGFYLGDLVLFKSYLVIGSRTAALIMSFSPMLTAIIGWFFLKEKLTTLEVVAILISIAGIVTAISNKKMKLNIPIKGLLLALGGALGQSIGIILSKKGIGDYDPVAATQIRAIFGLASFAIMITIMGRWPKIKLAINDKVGMKAVTIGSIFGPFLGVSLALFAIQHTNTGVASTLMALVPIFIIWPSAIMFREKIKIQQIIGAIISIIGVSLFFL